METAGICVLGTLWLGFCFQCHCCSLRRHGVWCEMTLKSEYPKEVIHRYLKTSLHGPFRSLNNGGVFSDLKITSWGCFLQLLRLPGINGKSQTGQKVCPSHVVEEFKVEFQFLDLRGIQKTNKYILKDSVMWLAVFFFPPGHSPTCLCYTESHCNEMFLLSTGRSFSPGKKRKCLFVLYGSP